MFSSQSACWFSRIYARNLDFCLFVTLLMRSWVDQSLQVLDLWGIPHRVYIYSSDFNNSLRLYLENVFLTLVYGKHADNFQHTTFAKPKAPNPVGSFTTKLASMCDLFYPAVLNIRYVTTYVVMTTACRIKQ